MLKIIGKILVSILLLGVSIAQPLFAHAEQYEEITNFQTLIKVNTDASISVREIIDYDFGSNPRHGIYRDIISRSASGKVMTIGNISVTDENSKPIHYQTSFEGSSLRIKIGDPLKTVTGKNQYVISYRATNALDSYKDFDEIYWNATGNNWQVPIMKASAKVELPFDVAVSELRSSCYQGPSGSKEHCQESPEVSSVETIREKNYESAGLLDPGGGLTVATGFPKGFIIFPQNYDRKNSQSVFDKYYGVLIGILLVLCSVIYAIVRWSKERAEKNDATIVPEYEPPQNLPPAILSVILNEEGIGSTGITATIVDLAVRGYLKINRDVIGEADRSKKYTIALSILFFAGIILATGFGYVALGVKAIPWATVVFIVLYVLFYLAIKKTLKTEEYLITKNEVAEVENQKLRKYEKEIMSALFGVLARSDGVFSTMSLKKSSDVSKASSWSLARLQMNNSLYKDVESETNGYKISITKEKKFRVTAFAWIYSAVIALIVANKILQLERAGPERLFSIIQVVALLGGALISAVIFVISKNDAELNKTGIKLYQQILGFKMYLETAEKYRMQNLTPETFERFLPYAIIFGIEKKWQKNFQSMNLQTPRWYSGPALNSNMGFSALSLSINSSLASSFAYASSGRGHGGSGGGGFSGGGGGGGGGGSW